jgi:hypothetical protein
MKKEKPPFKMIPVSVRECLHEFTGAELKLFLCLFLHSGKDNTAYPSNKTIMKETGLSRPGLKEAKKGLRRKGLSVPAFQRRRDDGGLSSMTEKIVMPIPRDENHTQVEIENIPTQGQNSCLSRGQESYLHEVDTPEVDTANANTGKPQDQNQVSESVSEEGSSLRSSPIADDKRKTKPVQVCEQEQEQHRDEEQPEPVPFIPDTDEDDYDLPAHEFRITDEQAAFYDPGVHSSRLGRDLDHEEYLVAEDLFYDLLPHRDPEEGDVVLLAELALEFTAQTVRATWSYNQRHKNGKLKFFGVRDLAAALRSDSDRCLLNQMRVHDENISACERCKGLDCCIHCRRVEDMTRSQYYGNPPADDRRSERFYLHKGCERAYTGI